MDVWINYWTIERMECRHDGSIDGRMGATSSYQGSVFRLLGVKLNQKAIYGELSEYPANHVIFEISFPCHAPITANFFWDYFSLIWLIFYK